MFYYQSSTMLGTPPHCSTPRSIRAYHNRKRFIALAFAACLSLTVLHCSLTPIHRWSSRVQNTNANSVLGTVDYLADIINGIHSAEYGTASVPDRSRDSSSSSSHGNAGNSSWTSLRRMTTLAGHSTAKLTEDNKVDKQLQQLKTEIQRAMQVLGTAGVQLDGLQQLQLDRIRMRAELYSKYRLQQRQSVLKAEVTAAAEARAAAAAVAAAAKTLDNKSLTNSRSNGSSQGTTAHNPNRGILIVAGSRDQMANALVSVITLRVVLNCTLPIELVHYGDQERDPLIMQILEEYVRSGPEEADLTVIDGSNKHIDISYHYQSWSSSSSSDMVAAKIEGFAAKAHALAYVTSFQQVLMLDADSLPLIDPSELFDSDAFVLSGNLFWPDFWKRLWLKEEFYVKLGQEVPWEQDSEFRSAESGQLLIDRLKHVDVLEWLWWLNHNNNVTYANMHGDKDTYRLAFALAGKASEYQQVKLPPRDAMTVLNGTGAVPGILYVHQGMVQHTPDDRPAFLHRTDKGKLFPYCAEKIDASSCQVDYVTVPLTEAQAMLALQRGLTYSQSQADVYSYPVKCISEIAVNPDRPDDPSRCALNEGRSVQPVPLVPISEFSRIGPVLQASYSVFEQVRTLLAIGQKLQTMRKQGLFASSSSSSSSSGSSSSSSSSSGGGGTTSGTTVTHHPSSSSTKEHRPAATTSSTMSSLMIGNAVVPIKSASGQQVVVQ